MIPTIEEICNGLYVGDYTIEQAVKWLYQHMELTDARFKAARQFAAAWLPIVAARGKDIADFHLSDAANAKGIAMADDLLRRLRETQT